MPVTIRQGDSVHLQARVGESGSAPTPPDRKKPSRIRIRARYAAAVMTNGYRWLSGLVDHASRLLFVAGLLAAPVLGAVVLVWQQHAPPWVIPAAVGFVLLIGVFEGAFQTYRDALPRTSTLQTLPATGLTARRRPVGPQRNLVISASTTDHLVLSQGILAPVNAEGDLPLRVEMEGIGGMRQGQPNNKPSNPWLWTAPNVQLVNASNEVLLATVWLVTRGKNPKRTDELKSDGELLRLEPHGNIARSFEFPQQTSRWSNEEQVNPPETWPELELAFLEVGTTRAFRVRFSTVPVQPVQKP